ncbi:DNA recombination protein RmuC [Lactovum miscens]|uniref:DNA recombination protein RmuC n=2 Tax=Lactovum miscens TaxID=190387 RepID=A0A841C571_9LACT|nr:DNA recombination protein RmuC [Lactovum miscens]MBB5887417.1 DNA recombination protein RmuC [Lactovum miscens]
MVGKIENLSGNLSEIRQDLRQELGQSRQEINSALNQVIDITSQNMLEFAENNNKKLAELTEQINSKFDRQFKDLQESNERKLEQIQKSVDEKLQETLQKSISQSFEQVQVQLKSVEQGLGQMRNLASDVGSLSKVMSGIKTRGIIGELQLNQILEDIMPRSQYREQENIQGANKVDFVVVLPGKMDNAEVLLPIDSKFPLEDYQRLIDAQETNDQIQVDQFRKELLKRIREFAKDISGKYILPPKTTDFAIMFLPTEGLFMEIVNAEHGSFIDQIRRDFKVNITGPTTMTAVLNSLQMGFKTLQIEKKSTEVFNLLTNVKTEFSKYGGALEAIQKDLQKSNKDIDHLINTRTNMMNRQLNKLDALDSSEELNIEEG